MKNEERNSMRFLYKTTECVSAGHPDKVADVISDSVLDAHLALDPRAKVACEVMIKDDIVVLGGEISHSASSSPNLAAVVNEALYRIGYANKELSPNNYGSFKVMNLISQQSSEINAAVVGNGDEKSLGAGDQGIMWGYATDETPNYMPLGMYLARGIMNAMKPLDWDVLFADCKTQVTIEYDAKTTKPVRVSHVVVSCLHDQDVGIEKIRDIMKERLAAYTATLPADLGRLFFDPGIELIFNHAGSWTFGGPAADTGLTGRKIVVDAYGAECEVGGGAFSGKDGTKVDRSGAYAARYIAKNIVAAGYAKKCKVLLGYVIGNSEPVSFNIDFLGTGRYPFLDEQTAERIIRSRMQLTPGFFIEKFKLTEPRFAETASNGHFGVTHYPWEQIDLGLFPA